jgi:hypothetical protein
MSKRKQIPGEVRKLDVEVDMPEEGQVIISAHVDMPGDPIFDPPIVMSARTAPAFLKRAGFVHSYDRWRRPYASADENPRRRRGGAGMSPTMAAHMTPELRAIIDSVGATSYAYKQDPTPANSSAADAAIAAFNEYQAKHAESNPQKFRGEDFTDRGRFFHYLGWIRTATKEIDDHLHDIQLSPLAYVHRWEIIAKEFEEIRMAASYAKHAALNAAEQATGERPKYPKENPCGGEFTPRSPLVHWSKDPEKRKRQRQHIRESIAARGNPEIGEYPEEMATAIIPPTSFALLGELVEIQIEGKRGGVRTIRPRSNAAALLASTPRAGAGQHGSDLWIVWPTSARKTKGPRSADARAAGQIFRRWSKFEPRVSIKMQVGDDGPRHKLGRVLVIRYRSDKWTGEPVLYEHKFTGRKFAYADKKTAPRMILVMNTDGGEMITERGIVG